MAPLIDRRADYFDPDRVRPVHAVATCVHEVKQTPIMTGSRSVPPAILESLPYEDARGLARTHAWREKALVYVTRRAELLVLGHTIECPDAGLQVPAGGVEPGETPGAAAVRELFEETGLQATTSPVYLESHFWSNEEAPSRIRHYYWVTAPADTPNAWSHVVSAGEGDQGMTFHLSFRPLANPGLTPGYGWEAALDRVSSIVTQP